MNKRRNLSFYIILGLPVSITIILTNSFGFSGLFNILAGFIMTLYSMYVYFKPDNNIDISSLISSFFLSAAFVVSSTFFLSFPLWLLVLGLK